MAPARLGKPRRRTVKIALRTPSRLVLLLVVAECLLQSAEHLGRSLEHRLGARIVDLLDVAAQVIDQLLKSRRDLLRMMLRVALCRLNVTFLLHDSTLKWPLADNEWPPSPVPASASSNRRWEEPATA